MSINDFLIKLDNGAVSFDETMAIIKQHYVFKETAFSNNGLENKTGQNSGSCQLFAFAKLQNLSKQQTLNCFGGYYLDDVLNYPESDNHQNIRNFIKTGWQGIQFDGDALTPLRNNT